MFVCCYSHLILVRVTERSLLVRRGNGEILALHTGVDGQCFEWRTTDVTVVKQLY